MGGISERNDYMVECKYCGYTVMAEIDHCNDDGEVYFLAIIVPKKCNFCGASFAVKHGFGPVPRLIMPIKVFEVEEKIRGK